MRSLAKQRERLLPPVDVEDRPLYPSFYVDNKQMPEINKWKVGKTYTIKVKIKMNSYSQHEDSRKKGSSADFDILGYEVAKKTLS